LALKLGIQTYQILTNDDEVCIPSLSKGTLCFEYFSKLFWILNWFRNVCIISSRFERWWCNKTGQACNLEIILVKIGVRSVWFEFFLSLCKVNYPIIMSFLYFNHFKKKYSSWICLWISPRFVIILLLSKQLLIMYTFLNQLRIDKKQRR
jgi:hypothetical protein